MEIAIYNDVYADTVRWLAESTRLNEALLLAAHDIAKASVKGLRARIAVRQLGDLGTTFADHVAAMHSMVEEQDSCDICHLLGHDRLALLAIVGR